MAALEQLQKAKAQLILGDPFFASIAMNFDFIEDKKVETGKADGKRVKHNPEWIEKQTLSKTVGFLAHISLHIATLHHTRMGLRDAKKWNKACDYAINPILMDSGYELPDDSLVDEKYRDMPAETVYNMLIDEEESEGEGDDDESQDSGNSGSDPGGCGEVEPSDAEGDAELSEEEDEVREMVAQAEANAEKAGLLPGHLKRFIEQALQPKVDWKEVLARFLCEIVRDDYSFLKVNTRFLHTGFYLPSLYNEEVGEVFLFVDTSMSINQRLLDNFGGEMQEIVNTFGKGFHVVYVDTKVQDTQYIEADGPVQLKPSGGGGTDFKPGFEWIEANDYKPKAVVYFTDGWCESYPSTPDYPVLWATYGRQNFNPPFGEVVNVIV